MDSPIFILQLVCCVVTTVLLCQLVITGLQVRWKVWRYELSRWLLCTAMFLLSVHYVFQMTHGLRAQGADVGAAFNILFYTPVAFAITISIINIECTDRKRMRRYCCRSAIAYALIAIVFTIGVVRFCSLHIGDTLFLMLALFVASMAYFIHASLHEIANRKKRLTQDSGSDLIPYVRYSQASITLLCLSAAILPVAIIFNTLLIIIGPLMMLIIIFFVQSFISLGFYLSPKEEIIETEEEEETTQPATTTDGNAADGQRPAPSALLSSERTEEIRKALAAWCEAGRYKDCDVNIFSLATSLGCKKNELTLFFNQSEHTNFRTWLSDIRFNEAVRMMKAYPNYSNDTISTECGFSSHTQIYRVFKQKTGMSPSQWRDALPPHQNDNSPSEHPHRH